MATWLKQSTSVDVPIGPFLDETDGKTAETALTITQADIRLKKNNGNWAQKNASQTLTHEENGWYEVTLDGTDTNTLGILVLAIHESGALPCWREFMVVAANVYDSIVGGGDTLDVQVTGIGADVITATSIAANAITAAKIATDAIDADALAADAVTEIQSGLATAAALAVVDDFVDTEVAAILAAVDTEVAAIKAKTDNLPAAPAATGDAMTLTAGERNSVADALLDRNMGTGADNGSTTVRTVRQALRFLRNKWSISAGTLTVCKEDDATTSWTSSVTTDAAANPVTANDPAGP